jgi:hypothetical protein
MVMRRRHVILLAGVPVYLLVHMIVGTVLLALIATTDEDFTLLDAPALIAEMIGEPSWWAYAGVPAIVLVALQAVFIAPVVARRPPREHRGHSLTVSLVAAGVIAGLLSMGLGAAAIDLIMLLRPPEIDFDAKGALWIVPVLMLAGGWGFWTLLLLFFVRGIWADRVLGRVIGLLLAGTFLEMLVVLPIDAMVRRRTQCYCGAGTFVSLSVAATATLWMVGPGIVVALMTHRHRRWRERYCSGCGYDKGPSPGPQCPECGTKW